MKKLISVFSYYFLLPMQLKKKKYCYILFFLLLFPLAIETKKKKPTAISGSGTTFFAHKQTQMGSLPRHQHQMECELNPRPNGWASLEKVIASCTPILLFKIVNLKCNFTFGNALSFLDFRMMNPKGQKIFHKEYKKYLGKCRKQQSLENERVSYCLPQRFNFHNWWTILLQ